MYYIQREQQVSHTGRTVVYFHLIQAEEMPSNSSHLAKYPNGYDRFLFTNIEVSESDIDGIDEGDDTQLKLIWTNNYIGESYE